MLPDATSAENEVCFENEGECGGNKRILYHKTDKEASTVLCSVVRHLGSNLLEHSRSREKYSTMSRVSPYTSFML